MLARMRKSLDENQKGFTLIELLVVVIIIGILAAIAIPMFLKQREKAWEKQVVSDMKNSITAAEALATSNNGKYTGIAGVVKSGSVLWENGARVTEGVTVTAKAGTGDLSYTLEGQHTNLGTTKTWTYDSNVGVIKNPEPAGTPSP